MFGYEAQLAGYVVLLALAGLALGQQLEVFVEHLHVVLRSANITSESGNGEAGLDLVGPDDDALQHYQAANQGRVQLSDRADGVRFGGAVDDGHLELAVHTGRDQLVLCEIS